MPIRVFPALQLSSCRVGLLAAMLALPLAARPDPPAGPVHDGCGAGETLAPPELAPGVGATTAALPGWYSGDTHVHSQPCGAAPDLSVEDLYLEQVAANLDMSWLLYWGVSGVQTYFDDYAPLVDGEEHAVSLADPDHFLQEAVEVSKFASSQFGHQIALCIEDAAFPDEKYPAPVLEHFRSQPDAVTGYAHVRWYNDYETVDPGANFHTGTSMGPVDAALGRIDFLEASFFDPLNELDFRGMYYKLLNCGMRLGLSGGTDNTCLYPDVGTMRNWVRLEEGEELSPKTWAKGLAEGRSNISFGGTAFVDLRVDGVRVGDELVLEEAGTVQIKATLVGTAGVEVQGQLGLVQEGRVVADGQITAPQGGGPTTLTGSVPVSRSTWFAVTLDGQAHSGAVWVTVGDRPMCSAADASYWIDMLLGLGTNLGPPFDTAGQVPQIQAEIADAIEVFEAVRICAMAPQAGTQPFGVSTPACEGPISIGPTGPPLSGTSDFALTCLHAPPDAVGVLALGLTSLEPGIPIDGADLLVADFFQVLPVASNGGGFAKTPVDLALSPAGGEFSAQYLWLNPADCGTGPLSASNGLRLTVQ